MNQNFNPPQTLFAAGFLLEKKMTLNVLANQITCRNFSIPSANGLMLFLGSAIHANTSLSLVYQSQAGTLNHKYQAVLMASFLPYLHLPIPKSYSLKKYSKNS